VQGQRWRILFDRTSMEAAERSGPAHHTLSFCFVFLLRLSGRRCATRGDKEDRQSRKTKSAAQGGPARPCDGLCVFNPAERCRAKSAAFGSFCCQSLPGRYRPRIHANTMPESSRLPASRLIHRRRVSSVRWTPVMR
jgi:hypothetical protein